MLAHEAKDLAIALNGLSTNVLSVSGWYERGKTQPHKSTVMLLKLLDRHPELLAEVMAA